MDKEPILLTRENFWKILQPACYCNGRKPLRASGGDAEDRGGSFPAGAGSNLNASHERTKKNDHQEEGSGQESPSKEGSGQESFDPGRDTGYPYPSASSARKESGSESSRGRTRPPFGSEEVSPPTRSARELVERIDDSIPRFWMTHEILALVRECRATLQQMDTYVSQLEGQIRIKDMQLAQLRGRL